MAQHRSDARSRTRSSRSADDLQRGRVQNAAVGEQAGDDGQGGDRDGGDAHGEKREVKLRFEDDIQAIRTTEREEQKQLHAIILRLREQLERP